MLNLPVWKVNGETFTNKLGAKLASKRLNKHIHFDLYDSKFLDFDWAYDDPESFESILYRRCKQLREKHNYIRLFYSGGHDSHTMLLAFMQSNTHIDEIVINIYAYWQQKSRLQNDQYTKNHPLNREQFRAAIPFIKKIASTIPRTKITIEHITGDYLLSTEGFSSTIQQNSLDITDDKMLHRKALFGEEKQHGVVNLLGAEKPRLKREGGKFYWYALDSNFVGVSSHGTNTGMFYVTPEMPELHRKQCHLMMKWIKQHFADGKDIDMSPNNLLDDRLRLDLNNTIRWPIWHPESNLGMGKKILSKNENYTGYADNEKTLILLEVPLVKRLMDNSVIENKTLVNKDKPYQYQPCFSYRYYLGT